MSNHASNPNRPGFLGILSFSLMAVPLLIVPAAFLAFDDAAHRAQTIISGIELTVITAGIALVLRALAQPNARAEVPAPAEQTV